MQEYRMILHNIPVIICFGGKIMKAVFQAMLCSLVLLIIYIAGSTLFGFIKTRNYQPDFSEKLNKVETPHMVEHGVSLSSLSLHDSQNF
jgi:hypothetical protein